MSIRLLVNCPECGYLMLHDSPQYDLQTAADNSPQNNIQTSAEVCLKCGRGYTLVRKRVGSDSYVSEAYRVDQSR